jgi:hypothetical protein
MPNVQLPAWENYMNISKIKLPFDTRRELGVKPSFNITKNKELEVTLNRI